MSKEEENKRPRVSRETETREGRGARVQNIRIGTGKPVISFQCVRVGSKREK